jgi:hypothetical protein
MAVVRANYVKRGKNERKGAKANIRYIQERPGRDKEKLTRTLFGAADSMGRYEAYQFINDAPKGTYFYRLKLSPDPVTEDTKRDLHMQKLTRQMMQGLEKRLKTAIPWAGALHDDHTDKRHVHILAAIPRRLQKYELEALIRQATTICREQRRVLDLSIDRHVSGLERTNWRKSLKFSNTYQTRNNGRRPYLSIDRQDHKHPFIHRGATPARIHTSCTCPRCHFSQSHDSHGVHSCVSCGRILHKKREPTLQRKGREWERSL